MDKERSIIYTAGYIDGDGCFHLSHSVKKFRNALCISGANEPTVHFFKEQFGGAFYHSKQRPGHKPIFQFRKQGLEARQFAAYILPHLVQRKKECELFISFFDASCKKKKLNIIKELKIQHAEKDLISFEDIEKLKKVQPLSPAEKDFIYMAGFIDAECCFTISKYKPKNRPNHVYKIVLQLNDTKYPMFYWIKSRFGGYCNFYKRKSRLKNQLTWRLTGKILYPFLKKVHPYLGYKKPVAEKLIEFFETSLPNGGDRQSKAFKDAYSTIIKKRESIIQQVHDLNKKGL